MSQVFYMIHILFIPLHPKKCFKNRRFCYAIGCKGRWGESRLCTWNVYDLYSCANATCKCFVGTRENTTKKHLEMTDKSHRVQLFGCMWFRVVRLHASLEYIGQWRPSKVCEANNYKHCCGHFCTNVKIHEQSTQFYFLMNKTILFRLAVFVILCIVHVHGKKKQSSFIKFYWVLCFGCDIWYGLNYLLGLSFGCYCHFKSNFYSIGYNFGEIHMANKAAQIQLVDISLFLL